MDRHPRRRLLMVGFILMAAAASVAAAATSVALFLVCFVLDGIAKILLFSAVLALPSDFATGARHDRALGCVIGSFSLAGFTALPLAGALADATSWRAGYVVALCLAFAALVLATTVLPSVQPESRPHASLQAQARALAALPGFPLALVGALFRFTMFSAVLTYAGAFLIDAYGVDVAPAGLYFALGALAFLLASVTSAPVGTLRVLVAGGLTTSTFVCLALALDEPLAFTGGFLLAAVWLMGLLENASTGMLLRVAPHDRGAAMSLNELMAAASSLLGIGAGAAALRLSGFTGIGVVQLVVGLAGAVTTHRALRVARASYPA